MSHHALGPQFKDHVRVFRGLAYVTPDEMNQESVGSHWSYNPNVAYNFATDRDIEGNINEFSEGDEHGTVLAGYVHPQNIVKPGTPEHDGWRDGDQVQGEGSMEEEATVRPGAPVFVTEHSYIHPDGHEEYTKYPPRRYTA